MTVFVKRRSLAAPGSIADALDISRSEVRFYREIAPVIGIRVPACYRAEVSAEGTLLELEDLSTWTPGADPEATAELLHELHSRWQDEAPRRWPWLRPIGAAVDLIENLYAETWPRLVSRGDLSPAVQALGHRLVGNVTSAEHQLLNAGPPTLVHGDASAQNLRTSPTGEVALLDWEDVSAAPGILDLGWHLLSSVDPNDWPATIAVYGHDTGLNEVLPSLIVQGLLSLADHAPNSPEAETWRHRLNAAAKRLEN
jgi:phosphotransferase family enzyme